VAVSAKNQWCKLIGRAWSDPAFKSKLLSDPVPILRSYHLEVPDKVRVVEDPKAKIGDWHWEGSGDGRTMVVPLPPMPSNWDETVTDSELSVAAGAASGNWAAPAVAGAGTAHPGWALPEGGSGTGWTSKGTATGQGPNDSRTWDGANRSGGNTKHSVPSVPSIPSVPSDDGGGGGDDGSDSSDSSDASDASDACSCSTCL
jgi:hypothetical protein